MKRLNLILVSVISTLLFACNKEINPPIIGELDTPITPAITSKPGGGIMDIDGNTYKTIVLGNSQEWMTSNLRTTHCSDGSPIPNVEDHEDWYNLSSPAWVYYDNNQQYNFPYGKLYNWHTVRDCAVCPDGWRVPSIEDWNKLKDYLSPNSPETGTNDAGSKLKVTGQEYWYGSNNDASNLIDFSAYPGGIRGNGFHSIRYGAFWWSSTIKDETVKYPEAYYKNTIWGTSGMGGSAQSISDGFAIRCIKN